MPQIVVKHSIECWIFDHTKECFLLLQCPENDSHPSYWQPVTGGIEKGERKVDACLREISEEAGVVLNEENMILFLEDFRVYAIDKELHKTVFITKTQHLDVKISDEHIDFKWVAPSDVLPMLLWGSNRATFQRVLEFLDLG